MSYTEISCKNVSARNEYRCSWCGETILKGELHQTRFYIFEGNTNNSREHLECAKAMSKASLFSTDLGDGYMVGDYKRGSCEFRG